MQVCNRIWQRELRGICGNIGQLEAPPTTCHKCKSGVQHPYCTRNHIRPSKSVADHDMAQVKPRNNITVGTSRRSKYVEQTHPTRYGNTQNDTSAQKAKEWYKHDFLWGMFRSRHGKLRCAMEGRVVQDVNIDDDVDMKVDMVGRELVGTVDVVIPKQSSDSSPAKIPRNFDLNVVAPVPRDFDLNVVPSDPRDFDLNVVPSVPRDFDLNVVPSVPRDFDLNAVPSVPRDFDLNVVPSVPRDFDLNVVSPVSRDFDLNVVPSVPLDFDLNDIPPEPTSNFTSA